MVCGDKANISTSAINVNYFPIGVNTFSPGNDDWYCLVFICAALQLRVATKIFKGFGEALFKEFIMGRELV